MTCRTSFGTYDVSAKRAAYNNNGRLAIVLTEEESPFATLTVNLPEYTDLAENEQYVDINNCPWAADFIKENKLGEPVGSIALSGFCTYPLYAFDLSKLETLEN